MPNITAEDVFQAGVVGAGGAGFPTHVKLAAKADTVLINAARSAANAGPNWNFPSIQARAEPTTTGEAAAGRVRGRAASDAA